ncbi:MAG: winged helix-turn-helix domain-containing protein [Pirellulales bacterium]|nr:winged helix-turn-helix domain-containing protein [Pirellulales bacterium]
MSAKAHDDYRESLRQLAEGYAAIVTHYERTIALLQKEQHRYLATDLKAVEGILEVGALRIDEGTFSVEFETNTCFLGNTIQLRLFRRLLRRRNRYVDHAELLEYVWDGVRSPATIRSAVKLLRRQLQQAGMGRVADAVVGTVAGHYALMVDRLQ